MSIATVIAFPQPTHADPPTPNGSRPRDRQPRSSNDADSPPASERVVARQTPPASDVSAERGGRRLAREAELLAKYAPLVRQIAGGFQRKLPKSVQRDDLLAAGMSGLWDAVRKHGHDTGENFDWYVRVRIRGAIVDELRAQDWLPRRARAAAAEAALSSGGAAPSAPVVLRFDDVSEAEQSRCLATSDTIDAEAAIDGKLLHQSLCKAVDQLPERERKIVSLHYFKGMKFKELGQMLGVSEPRISQLHSRAMGRLRLLMERAA